MKENLTSSCKKKNYLLSFQFISHQGSNWLKTSTHLPLSKLYTFIHRKCIRIKNYSKSAIHYPVLIWILSTKLYWIPLFWKEKLTWKFIQHFLKKNIFFMQNYSYQIKNGYGEANENEKEVKKNNILYGMLLPLP